MQPVGQHRAHDVHLEAPLHHTHARLRSGPDAPAAGSAHALARDAHSHQHAALSGAHHHAPVAQVPRQVARAEGRRVRLVVPEHSTRSMRASGRPPAASRTHKQTAGSAKRACAHQEHKCIARWRSQGEALDALLDQRLAQLQVGGAHQVVGVACVANHDEITAASSSSAQQPPFRAIHKGWWPTLRSWAEGGEGGVRRRTLLADVEGPAAHKLEHGKVAHRQDERAVDGHGAGQLGAQGGRAAGSHARDGARSAPFPPSPSSRTMVQEVSSRQ